jgi:hypothetical protein
MPQLTIFGHPVHPILQAIPASLLPVSTTFDALARLGVHRYRPDPLRVGGGDDRTLRLPRR